MSLYPSLNELITDEVLTESEKLELELALHLSKQEVAPLPEYSQQPEETFHLAPELPVSYAQEENRSPPTKQNNNGLKILFIRRNPKGQLGFQIRSFNEGIFVSFVTCDTPAAQSGLRFGDQITKVNGENITKMSASRFVELFKNFSCDLVEVQVKPRPYEFITTLNKDLNGKMGFVLENGCITEVKINSPAAKAGLTKNQQIIEINGFNVIGLKDEEILLMLESIPVNVTLTIMAKSFYKCLIKNVGSSQLKREMDRTMHDM